MYFVLLLHFLFKFFSPFNLYSSFRNGYYNERVTPWFGMEFTETSLIFTLFDLLTRWSTMLNDIVPIFFIPIICNFQLSCSCYDTVENNLEFSHHYSYFLCKPSFPCQAFDFEILQLILPFSLPWDSWLFHQLYPALPANTKIK